MPLTIRQMQIRRQLTQASKLKRRRKPKKIQRLREPRLQQLQYQRLLSRMVRDLQRIVREEVIPQTPGWLAAAQVERAGVREDAIRDTIGVIFGKLAVIFGQVFSDGVLETEIRSVATGVDSLHSVEFIKQTTAGIGVPVIRPEPWKQALMRDFVTDNVKLTKSLTGDALRSFEQIVSNGIRGDLRTEDIAKELQAKLGVTKARAKFLARDQVGKLQGELTQHRQQGAGIKEYTWSTSKDERVRHDHQLLEGTTQQWSKAPIVDRRTGRRAHPGRDFQCRCQPIPKIPAEFLA